MFAATVEPSWSLDAWRTQARLALRAGVAPEDVHWQAGDQVGLSLGGPLVEQGPPGHVTRVPAGLLALAGSVLCHRDVARHALLYRLLWRIAHGQPRLLQRASDADVAAANALAQAVRRDCHKMKAFVRFRALSGEDDMYVAWFEPGHFIVDRVGDFFVRRFAGMRWAILTPYRSVRWDGRDLSYGPGGVRSDAPGEDAQEALWRTYYANIFNPARLNPRMMRQEMPQKYWAGLPETHDLPLLLRTAGSRVRDMSERAHQPPRRRIPAAVAVEERPVPEGLDGIRAAASACRRCELFQPATQTVMGEGPSDARVMIIGEQPGDEEDLAGRPFVGPAGKLLDRAISSLGLNRHEFYVTNAVKHFRFERRGKRRLHRNPAQAHVSACGIWLGQELASIRPAFVICLGATAAQALLGPGFRVLENRGLWHELDDGIRALATVHPSWILRQPHGIERERAYEAFVNDLGQLRMALAPAATVNASAASPSPDALLDDC